MRQRTRVRAHGKGVSAETPQGPALRREQGPPVGGSGVQALATTGHASSVRRAARTSRRGAFLSAIATSKRARPRTWIMNSGMTRWNTLPAYPYPFSPVHSVLKFSTVRGTTPPYKPITTRPSFSPPTSRSKYTWRRDSTRSGSGARQCRRRPNGHAQSRAHVSAHRSKDAAVCDAGAHTSCPCGSQRVSLRSPAARAPQRACARGTTAPPIDV